MTPPMTPREKVANAIRVAVGEFRMSDGMAVIAANAAFDALASGSGDHAELEYYGYRAFNAGIGCCHLVANPGPNDTNPEPLVTAASALALLAENAALRARENELIAGHAAAVTALERKLAEADTAIRKAARQLSSSEHESSRIVDARDTLCTFLSKEAERG